MNKTFGDEYNKEAVALREELKNLQLELQDKTKNLEKVRVMILCLYFLQG
jgi:hypothetical protein